MKRVKCKSGIEGWQDKLQNVYTSYEEFEAYSDMYGIALRIGFISTKNAWDANPTIQGSTNPSDLCVVIEKPLKGQLLEFFTKHKESMFDVKELSENFNVEYKELYNSIQYLVRTKNITKIYPGLNGGRKCYYTLRNKNI